MDHDSKPARPIIIVDGFNCFLRHYFVNQEVNSRSQPVGGVVGFIRQIDNLTSSFSPSRIYVVWENGGPSPRRKKILPTYKANRAKATEMKKIQSGNESIKDALAADDETRIRQLTILAQLLKSTPICQIFIPETECDDIIAYLIKNKFRYSPGKKIIVSTDKDFYQLLDDPEVSIYDPASRNVIDAKKVQEKFGIAPRNFCMAKILAGDDSDNIPGIPGAGFTTITKRFSGFSDDSKDVDIAQVLSEAKTKIETSKKPLKIYEEVAKSEELLRRNWELMYLDSSKLSASQVSKIDYIVDSHEPKMNKLQFVKTIIEAGINSSFDVENFALQMRIFLR
jgi:DNA polymerase-1